MRTDLKIGTRGSALAMYQAELVKTLIEKDFPMLKLHREKIKTSGDMVRRGGINPLETKRMFTREIEEALLNKKVDMAVHSAKDMSVTLPEGTRIGAALEREDPRDCLISKDKKKLSELPIGSRIGTSSLRRRKLLAKHHPNLVFEDARGNIDTRIKKVEDGVHDAIVLAYAGVKRLGLENYVSEIFSEDIIYPAPCQGIIVVQSRIGDRDVDEMLEPINHAISERQLVCERAFLRRLEGGCQLPCGISTRHLDGELEAKGILFAVEGTDWVEADYVGPAESPEMVGDQLARLILEKGGRVILDKIKNEVRKK